MRICARLERQHAIEEEGQGMGSPRGWRWFAPGTLWLWILGLAFPAAAQTDPPWRLLNPLPTSADLADIAFGDETYVAVGELGTILRSADGLAWSVVAPPVQADLEAVTWNGALFVAVGAGGVVLTSRDGETWSMGTSGVAVDLHGVTSGPGGLLVAVGDQGTVLVSADGGRWSARASGTEYALRAVTWAGEAFVAAGDGGCMTGTGTVLSSRDLVSWVPAQGEIYDDLGSVAAHGSTVVFGAALCWRWPEGWYWSSSHYVGSFTDGGLVVTRARPGWGLVPPHDLAWCLGQFVSVNQEGVHSSSSDGLEWHATPSLSQALPLDSVVCGPSGPVAVGLGGHIASSPDGAHWRASNSLVEHDLAVASDGVSLVAIAESTPHVLSSQDGLAWGGPADLPSEWVSRGIAYGRGRFVIAGYATWCGPWVGCWDVEGVVTSTDGLTWEDPILLSGGSELEAITWDGTRFVAVGWYSLVTSANGVEWVVSETDWGWRVAAVASDGATLVAVDEYGGVRRNADGATWEEVELPGLTAARDVAFAAGRFVVVGDSGAIFTSADGLAWQAEGSGTERDLLGVDAVGDGLVTVGVDGALLTSADGSEWRLEETGLAGDLLALTASGCGATVVGRHGVIARAPCPDDEQPPRAAFAWRPLTVIAGQPVELVDLSTGAPTWWRWELGDGSTATGPQTVHAWDAPGANSVQLMVGNARGADAITNVVEVIAPCAAPTTPRGLTGPEMAGSSEYFTISWDEVEGATSYLFQERGGEPPPRDDWHNGGVTYDTVASRIQNWTPPCTIYGYRVRAVRECFDGAWQSPWSEPIEVEVVPTVAEPGWRPLVVPAAAFGAGLGGRPWTTDLSLHNPGSEVAYAAVLALDGAQPVGRLAAVELEPGGSARLADVLTQIPGQTPATCGLLIACRVEIAAVARSAGAAGAGAVPAVPLQEAQSGDQVRYLPGLVRGQGLYTNVGASNPSGERLEVVFTLFDQDGWFLGAKTLALEPYASAMASDLFAQLGHEAVTAGFATVANRTAEGCFVAWSSLVDSSSGDSLTQVATTTPPVWHLDEVAVQAISVSFGNGLYVAGGYGFSWSPDGREWQSQDGQTLAWQGAVRWNGREFVAVGYDHTAWSADGREWHEQPLARGQLEDLVWGDGQWLAVGGDGEFGGRRAMVGHSPDGREWQLEDLPEWRDLVEVEWIGTGFVAAEGESNNSDTHLLFSPDGVSWSATAEWWDRRVEDLEWNGSLVVAVGNLLATSPDGIEWTRNWEGERFRAVVWAGEEFIAWGDDGRYTRAFYSSVDGASWQPLLIEDEPPGVSESGQIDLLWDGAKVVAAHKSNSGIGLHWLVGHGPSQVVPGTAHRMDEQGRSWTTDLLLTNIGPNPVSCQLEALAATGVLPGRPTLTVQAQQTRRIDDVLGSLFDFEGEAAVRIVPSAATVVASGRTWATGAAGAVGQLAPALPEAAAVWHFAVGHLIGLERSARRHTDLGLISLCDEPMRVDIALVDDAGASLGELASDLPPFAATLERDVLGAVAAPEQIAAAALLTTQSLRCPFVAYASIVDLESGDRVLVPAVAFTPR